MLSQVIILTALQCNDCYLVSLDNFVFLLFLLFLVGYLELCLAIVNWEETRKERWAFKAKSLNSIETIHICCELTQNLIGICVVWL